MSYRKSLLVMVSLPFAGCGYTSTNPGEGVVFARFGQVEEKCYPAGFYFYNPFTTSVYHVDLRCKRCAWRRRRRSHTTCRRSTPTWC